MIFLWSQSAPWFLISLNILPRDSKNSIDSILCPIFGTAETSHISPPDAILDELHLFSSSLWQLTSFSVADFLEHSLLDKELVSAQGQVRN